MKNRFNTYDVVCIIAELQKLIGMRVNQVYDIDNRTYLIRLQRTEEKCVLLLESGNRLHTTAFEWPKNVAPSGFTMKLRKHLKNKRLEKLEQLGIDRIVDLQFGTAEAAYHVILELYDRGNIILTDYELTILNVLRPHTEGEEVRFVVREKYPVNRAKQDIGLPNMEHLIKALNSARPGDNLRTILNPLLECGPSVIDHVLMKYDLNKYKLAGNKNENETQATEGKKKQRKNRDKDNLFATSEIFNIETNLTALMNAINEADNILKNGSKTASKGYIIQRKELKPSQNDLEEYFYTNLEYHPMLFLHDKDRPYKEYDSFNIAVDEFYSALEGQKIDIKAIQQERDALKKLSNVKKDHAKRLDDLTKNQKFDRKKAELITRNQILVDNAILAIQSSLANQMSWPDIHELVKAAQQNNDPVANCIKQLKLEINHISLHLTDPFANLDDESDRDYDNEINDDKLEAMTIDIDLSLSAFANARKYYDQRRTAAKKEQKTIESSVKALKNAERKTQQTLKDVKIISTITKARKIYWFEKFYWFISSENYLIIGGRDQQQNELIVKRYMRPQDIYVHAEIQGASSVIIKNPTGNDVPPKTLLEAGTMAISYSVAWDAKVVTNAYWVKSEQVSKTAPTGEYLGTGSFMIRGKKNFLPPCHLILGLSFLFKLEDSSVERHKNERRVRTFDDADQIKSLNINEDKLETLVEEEIDLNDDEDAADDDFDNDKIEEKEKDHDKQSSELNDNSDDDMQYPDTHIKIEHDTGKVTIQSDPKFEILQRKDSTSNNDEGGDETVIFLGDDKPFIVKSQQSRVKQQNKKSKNKAQLQAAVAKKVQEEQEGEQQKSSQSKRGQKGKLKKIKEKYKDQDEDEREMRMAILKSAGTGSVSGGKDTKKGKKLLEQEIKIKRQIKMPEIKPNNDDETEEVPAAADVDMLDSLTGTPVDEDELLFSVPVIAPYQALHSYKYKVKLTPGTGKRGKAAKTALAIFLKDKTCTQREKDLLKSVKDETLARNIPGKVKLSAPQMHKIRK